MKPFVYGDVCSGISALTVAWAPLGFEPAFYAEIDRAASAVLRHWYPNVPNAGDFTTIQKGQYRAIDALVGGTPCQDFSIAGLRAGMEGERGNLTLEFLRLADRLRPRWLVWENVPGVLSSTSHRAPDPCPPPDPVDMDRDGQEVEVGDEYDSEEVHALNSFLAGLSELGYGWAYRVLDAQYAGVPQRRRRIFVVGHLGRLVESGDAGDVWDVRDASALSRAVLFERQSLSGDTPPRRESGQVAPTIPSRRTAGGGLGSDFDFDGGLIARVFGGNNTAGPIEVSTALNACATASGRMDFESETFVCSTLDASFGRLQGCAGQDANHGHSHLVPVAIQAGALRENSSSGLDGIGCREDGVAYTLEARPEVQAVAFHTSGAGFWADGVGTLRGREQDSHENVVAFDTTQITSPTCRSNPQPGDPCHSNAGGRVAVAVDITNCAAGGEVAGTLERSQYKSNRGQGVMTATMAVRRLTPRECERLQGFPDDYTQVPHRGKPMADGPRYKMLGNSMAVPVIRWIGERIQMVDGLRD